MNIACLIIFISLFYATITSANETIQVSHYQKHPRYTYGAELLALALSKLDQPYTLTALPHSKEQLNEARGELEVIEGRIDLEWMSTSDDRESSLIPVKVPIYQGLLGLRLLLINKIHDYRWKHLSTLEELRTFTGGHGLHWGDLPIYAENGLPVIPHKNYDSIFHLLELQRIDYFHRGLSEIWAELEKYQKTLLIADNVMLYYPHPVYFFVSKRRPELAIQLEKGLKIALEDGSFKALFDKTYRADIALGELDKRNLIILKNPTLPVGTNTIDTSMWLPTKFQTQIDTVVKQ